MDVIGFALLLFAHFGWGKPVNINERNFNRKRSMSAQIALVAVAGPLMNFFLAIVFSIILAITLKATNLTTVILTAGSSYSGLTIFVQLLMSCILVNLGLGIFNLIPLPPLDGSKILRNVLPYRAKEWYDRNYQILYLVFIVIWITPIVSTIITPLITGAYEGLITLTFKLFGLI